jgi:ribosomal protein S3
MGQKTNPNIFQINKTNEWNSKYIEKKSKDFYLHTIKDLEVKKFIYKFFKSYNLSIHNCKLNYSNNSLNIYISYQQDYTSIFLTNSINKTQKIKFINNSIVKINNKNRYNNVLRAIKNYYTYEYLIFKKYSLKKRITENKISTIKRLNILKYYKKYLNLKKTKLFKNLMLNNFLNKFFRSLNLFFLNKFITINLIIQPLNIKLINVFNKKKHDIIKKKLIKLKKYQKSSFFKEGTNIIFSLISKNNSAFLFSNFIAITLKKLKYHNFFFKFIKTALTIFISDKFISTKIQGIKIKIKGRLNKAPRAKSKIIIIGNLPIFTIDSNIDYAETTSYTSNGTLGVKVWMSYN